jgi:hypothetical protein
MFNDRLLAASSAASGIAITSPSKIFWRKRLSLIEMDGTREKIKYRRTSSEPKIIEGPAWKRTSSRAAHQL